MTKDELIARLMKIEGNPEVVILDGFNGGGEPRTINFGPSLQDVQPSEYVKYDTDDIETQEGKILLMGFGCY
jgi:hypothetical protein